MMSPAAEIKRAVMRLVIAMPAFAQGNLQRPTLTHSDDKWLIHNASNQPITAYIFHAGDDPMHILNGQNVGVGELEFEPMLPDTSKELPVAPGIQKIEIVAVVFEDGHVVGNAKTAEGIDLLEAAIFDNRRMQLEEWKKVAVQLASEPDHHKAFQDVYDAKPFISSNPDQQAIAHQVVSSAMSGLALVALQQPSDELRYQSLVSGVAARIAAAERLARRVK